jgi:hypothetical protein
MKGHPAPVDREHAVQHERVEVNVEIEGAAEALHDCHSAAPAVGDAVTPSANVPVSLDNGVGRRQQFNIGQLPQREQAVVRAAGRRDQDVRVARSRARRTVVRDPVGIESQLADFSASGGIIGRVSRVLEKELRQPSRRVSFTEPGGESGPAPRRRFGDFPSGSRSHSVAY